MSTYESPKHRGSFRRISVNIKPCFASREYKLYQHKHKVATIVPKPTQRSHCWPRQCFLSVLLYVSTGRLEVLIKSSWMAPLILAHQFSGPRALLCTWALKNPNSGPHAHVADIYGLSHSLAPRALLMHIFAKLILSITFSCLSSLHFFNIIIIYLLSMLLKMKVFFHTLTITGFWDRVSWNP